MTLQRIKIPVHRISDLYREGNEDILNAITASCIVKLQYSSSSIHNFSINRLQEILHTSFNTARETYRALVELGYVRHGNKDNKNLILSRQCKPGNQYVYVYACVDNNGVHLFNCTEDTQNFVCDKSQSFKEAKNIILELAMCTRVQYHNNIVSDSEEECAGRTYATISLEAMSNASDISLYAFNGWSKYFIKKGYKNCNWKLPIDFKDDKIRGEEQKKTRPLAISYISKAFFKEHQSTSTVRRLLQHATETGLLKKYDNARIIVYHEGDSSDFVNVDPHTSYRFDVNGKPTNRFFRITWREKKINGDLKKTGSTQPKVTEAWKQPGPNSYAVHAIGVLAGVAKAKRAAAFFS